MDLLIWLIILQALTVTARPYNERKRDVCRAGITPLAGTAVITSLTADAPSSSLGAAITDLVANSLGIGTASIASPVDTSPSAPAIALSDPGNPPTSAAPSVLSVVTLSVPLTGIPPLQTLPAESITSPPESPPAEAPTQTPESVLSVISVEVEPGAANISIDFPSGIVDETNGIPYVPVSTTESQTQSPISTLAITNAPSRTITLFSTTTRTATATVTAITSVQVITASEIFSGTTVTLSIVTSTVLPSVSVITTSAAQILPSLTGDTPATQGTIETGLPESGVATSVPLITPSITSPVSLISATGTGSSIPNTVKTVAMSNNIFQPIATDAPPSVISSRPDHPAPRLGIQPQNSPIGTNKFYANFFLGSQSAPSWTHPYSVAWSKGGGPSSSWGMAISHIDANQKVFGPDAGANPVGYFINPVGIQSIILSAAELGSSTTLSTDSITAFSTNVNLLPSQGAPPAITFPLVQGMGFVTAIYSGATPILQTGVFFRSVTKSASPKAGVTKYTILLEDGKTWLLYASSSTAAGIEFSVVNNALVQSTSNFQGIIQIAKNPGGGAEALYDVACGTYATSVALSGSTTGSTGSYSLQFQSNGTAANNNLVMFALPHHIQSFDSTTSSAVTNVQLNTTTKGMAAAVVANCWTLVEDLPTAMDFAPCAPSSTASNSFSSDTISAIKNVASVEVSQNMSQQTNLNSMYFSGKALAKFAGIVYTIHDLLGDVALAQAGLVNLKASFDVFAGNTQDFPLVHETAWGGIVSSATYTTGDAGADFGNTYYNDHHFHYGYFIYTAAVIGYLDPTWLAANKDYVNSLVRDIANPSTDDNYFPVYRSFDWYHGHSWAHGLYESFDGKDEESSSEDAMSAYAIKMWGRTVGDSNMEARGNLQLAITSRALQNYFLYTQNNGVEPANFIGNKVSGILFENKIDHTTYFGNNIEYIQGIHMIPLLPSSTLTRTQQFVTEEWNTYFSNGRVDTIAGGWRGILYANLAIIDPKTAWAFFSQPNFDMSLIDGGASLTWYLALAAGWGA